LLSPLYGMGRFPVTLYKEQWLKLLDMSADIRGFIAANEPQLKTKDQKWMVLGIEKSAIKIMVDK
jgi:hypothetical protein